MAGHLAWLAVLLFVILVRAMCFQALPILQKFFENPDKTKNFSSLKFSVCLNEREIIYSMSKQYIDFQDFFKCKWRF